MKNVKHAAIVTARAGSKSIIDKNVFPVRGKPMVHYPIMAAQSSKYIDHVYVSTDGKAIAEASRELDCTIIDRPEELSGDTVNHGDVIKHATEWVWDQEPGLETVTLLLGNTVMIDGELIDEGIQTLIDDPDLDSTMTVWEAADDHPLRALEIRDGILVPYGGGDRQVSTERQSYPKAYYYDQGIWVFRKDCIKKKEGPNPWWWMGKRSKPIVRNWVTGRDVHTMLDIGVGEWWLDNYPKVKDL